MAEYNVRVPPDSTGKRIHTKVFLFVNYTNKTGSWQVGETVTFVASGVTGDIVYLHPADATTGHLYILLSHASPTITSIGENIQVNAVTVAQAVDIGEEYHNQAAVIAGGNNPFNSMNVDGKGAASVRFTEGAPQLDAFGKMQISTQHKIAEYVMGYNELPNDFTDTIVGGATLTYEPNVRGVALTCGTGITDEYIRTSDEYHVHQAGISQLIEMTCAVGDTGKTNVIRRWGYYDDNNGIFFELNDTTINVGFRSKSTGSVVNTTIPQSQWNEDRVNGSAGSLNLSGYTLDVSKDNIYWIDFQWLGAGSIRFGVIIDGQRIVCHEIRNANQHPYSYMTSGSLPLRYMQRNTGDPGSSSQFRFFCATVKTEGTFNPFVRAFSDNSMVTVTGTDPVPALGIRSAQTWAGINNRSTIYPNSFSIYNASNVPILFQMWRGVTATNGSWVSHGGESTAEINKTMTAFTGGKARHQRLIGPNSEIQVDFKAFQDNRRGIRRKADITLWIELALTFSSLAGGSPVLGGDVHIVLNWDEVRD